ncbi:MAG: LLM class flavin-dependent oxidoreductase [Alphaproteobacteria bacterium]|jgi:alkanesulfonate monooxygenase SsuD/methylene tetrahydromethanopterin reductase-like flavin-dependent oxidoreductase (luciferase family)
MKFGGMVAPSIADWKIFPELEALGYDHGWVPDSQMIWSDCYATMALAAHHTSRLRLGTGVAIAGTRLAPVTAHSIASINVIAPGRVFLGIGTGHTAMRIMGQKPVKVREFAEYLRVLRGLLHGEEVEYTLGDRTRPIRFQDRELGSVNTDQPVPIYVAANGPKALKAAGAYGDGRISAGNEPLEILSRSLQRMQEGADEAGRTITDGFHTAALTFSCVLKPGEKLTSERVIDQVASFVVMRLHSWYEQATGKGHDRFVQDSVRGVWEDYKAHVEAHHPPERRHQTIHTGHGAFCPPEERKFVTPEMIQGAGGIVGEQDEIVDQLQRLEAAGLKEVTMLPPVAQMRENFTDFAEQIIPQMR